MDANNEVQDQEMTARRMMQGFEHKILEINKRNIRQVVGEISERDFLHLAETISIRRARYLKETLQLVSEDDTQTSIDLSERLLKCRQAYHESLRGFNALRHALEKGYCVLKTD